MIGVGFEHSGLNLSFSGASDRTKGVFINTHRNPILAMDQNVQGPQPPPFSEFLQSGLLLSEPANSRGAISMNSTIHGASNGQRSMTNGFLNQDKLRGYLQRTLQSQDSKELFQSKTHLNR
jgi:hypothetical protein